VDQSDQIVFGIDNGPNKVHFEVENVQNSIEDTCGCSSLRCSEFHNENSREAHLEPVFNDFRFRAFCDFSGLS